MADHEFEAAPGLVRRLPQEMAGQAEDHSLPAIQRDAVDDRAYRAGDNSGAMVHASTINRATASQSVRAERSLLRLQKQYGNRYVNRVVALARKSAETNEVPSSVEEAIQRERGGGLPLDRGVQGQMESAFGADFSTVRVHTDNQADALNRTLSARAFTTGQDVFFRQGAYEPGSSAGRELLAHELTHVVQQNGETIGRQLSLSQPGDPAELEAEHAARAVTQHELQRSATPDNEEEQPVMAKHDAGGLQLQPESGTNDEDEAHAAG